LDLPQAARVRCLECGAYNTGDRRFCQRCGAAIDLVMLGGALPTAPRPPQTVPEEKPAAQQPAMAKQLPPPERPAPVETQEGAGGGGRSCPQCGTGNDADRRFCRRCGFQLAAGSEAPAQLPQAPRESWWRRLLARFRGGEGERYQVARGAYRRSLDLRFRLLRIGAVLGSLVFFAGLFGIAGVNPWTAARNGWRNAFPSYTQITGIAAATEPEQAENREYAASFALDRAPDTAWAAKWTLGAGEGPAAECAVPPDGGGAEAALLLTLPEPTDLDRLEVQAGLPKGDPGRATQWRPTLLELRYDDGSCQQVKLGDKPGRQRHDISAEDTTSVRIVVRDAAPPTGGSGDLVALGEVGIYRKS
jgi:hypothetical protein